MKLISMTDFVLEQKEELKLRINLHYYVEAVDLAWKMINYAKFLKQLLELWMFIPCDKYGNILEEPKEIKQDDESICSFCSYPMEGRKISNFQSGCEGSRCESAWDNYQDEFQAEVREYQQAKERCLFDVECVDISDGAFKGLQFKAESFKMVEYNLTTKRFFYGCNIVEDLIDYDLELNKTAEKQIGV